NCTPGTTQQSSATARRTPAAIAPAHACGENAPGNGFRFAGLSHREAEHDGNEGCRTRQMIAAASTWGHCPCLRPREGSPDDYLDAYLLRMRPGKAPAADLEAGPVGACLCRPGGNFRRRSADPSPPRPGRTPGAPIGPYFDDPLVPRNGLAGSYSTPLRCRAR